MSGLRFVMITTFYPPYNFGGDGVYVRRLAHALVARGHTVDIIHDADAFNSLSGGREVKPIDEPDGVTVHRLEAKKGKRAGTLSLVATQQSGRPVVHGKRIAELLERGRYDVIHFHNISLVGGPGLLSYGDAIKLYTAHEHWLVCPSHILWRHNKEICTSRECLRCVINHGRPPQLWRRTDLLENEAKNVDAFLALSRFSADKHREFGFKQPMTVVPSFLPDDKPLRGSAVDGPVLDAPLPKLEGPKSPVRDEEATPYYLFVGRLEKIKGLQDVIPLFGPDAPAELWIAGSGDFEDELRRLAAGKPKVKFLGRRPPETLRSLYANAIALVTPSVCYEVFPLVVLEAFREGTPIIARDLGPYPEIVRETDGGLLFTDPTDLRYALRRLADDPALRDRLGAAAKVAFEARWSEDVSLAVYFDIIRRIAERRGEQHLVELIRKS